MLNAFAYFLIKNTFTDWDLDLDFYPSQNGSRGQKKGTGNPDRQHWIPVIHTTLWLGKGVMYCIA